MPTRSRSSVLGLSTVVLIGGLAVAQGQPVPVDVQSAGADIVLVRAGTPDRVLATTDANGKAAVDVTDFLNLGKLDVIEETCNDKTRFLLVVPGRRSSNDKNCRRRRVGAFWPGHDTALVAHGGGGMSTAAVVGLVAGGAGAAAAAAAIASHGSSTTSSNNGSSQTTNPMAFNGVYAGPLTATANNCGLPTMTTISGTLAVDSTGHGSWQGVNAFGSFSLTSTLTASGPSAASFIATGTQQVGSQVYSVSVQAAISGSTATVTVTVTGTSTTGGSCSTAYGGQLSKS